MRGPGPGLVLGQVNLGLSQPSRRLGRSCQQWRQQGQDWSGCGVDLQLCATGSAKATSCLGMAETE